jgi:AraC family transcriptional regulator
MNSFGIPFDLKVKLLNVAKCELDSSWNYCDLTSPFSRIYLISSGEGYIYPNCQKIKLEPDFLYLIPSYVPCSYTCSKSLMQYYLHFTLELADKLNIFDIYPYHFKAEAIDKDFHLLDRLLEINPNTGLQVVDPAVYQSKNWVNSTVDNSSISQHIETNGIIFQLFSRFLSTDIPANSFTTNSSKRFKETLAFIQHNIDKNISINELSAQAQMSNDHFTRSFKKEIGTTPLEYINQKRIEKAQLLLVVTSLSVNEILVKTGFNSASYFSRIFKTGTGLTPLEYRKFHQLLHSKFYTNDLLNHHLT